MKSPDEVAEVIEDALELEPKPKAPSIRGLSLEEYVSNPAITEIELPNAILINSYRFYGNVALVKVDMPKVTSIGEAAFYYCKNLALTSLPSGLKNIGTNAFFKCVGLISLTFKGIPSTIASDAFQECTNLKTINVPWEMGAVSGAPWGAVNATINYNYTEG